MSEMDREMQNFSAGPPADGGKTDPDEGTRAQAGWTLVEIMVGIAIVLILMTSVGVVLVGNIYKARQAAARDHIKTFALALDAYLLDCGEYPSREQGLKSLVEKPILSPVPTGWDGPYLQILTILGTPGETSTSTTPPGSTAGPTPSRATAPTAWKVERRRTRTSRAGTWAGIKKSHR